MITYKIDYSTNDGNYNSLQLSDKDDAIYEYEDLVNEHHQPAIVEVIVTEYYIYGGICQGSQIIKHWNREKGFII
mgnify:CR=1 FL=1